MEKSTKECSLFLKENPTLQDFQKYIYEMKISRGFYPVDLPRECMCMAEEVGELFSAVRKNMKGGTIAIGSVQGNVEEELADVFIYLCSLANLHDIDLEQAFRKKEEINKTRTWRKIE